MHLAKRRCIPQTSRCKTYKTTVHVEVFNVVITTDAEMDLIAAVDYYDAISPLLGTRFLASVQYAYTKLAQHPYYYKYTRRQKGNKLRCIRIKSFPYLIIFNVLDTNDVIIIAVLNTYRKTKYF